MYVTKSDGSLEQLDVNAIHAACEEAIKGIIDQDVDSYVSELELGAHLQMYDGISTSEIQTALVTAAGDRISEEHPEWSRIAANLLLRKMKREVKEHSMSRYLLSNKHLFCADPEANFNLEAIDSFMEAMDRGRVDRDFEYLGMKILYDRYLLRDKEGNLLETPSMFYMRVSMGVALAEKSPYDRTYYAKDFYKHIAAKKFSPATSTLFNSFLVNRQLSSCFLLSMQDSLEGIFDSLKEAATYSKFSGGIGMDMTNVRSANSFISSTKGRSSGVVPYIKLLEGTVRGFNQGGKRPGSAAIYLEPWHADIRQFLDVRNSSGDERFRAHDIFPALWIPDLFMQKVKDRKDWHLFNPGDHPELHELYGEAFEERYEDLVTSGHYVDKLPAEELWKQIIQRIFETGSYWPCFKDTANRRYAQAKSGSIKSSNLCTEILLRADKDVSAVCNLASLNLSRIADGELSFVVTSAVRFLDNVLDIGAIPHEKGSLFNQTDRAVGLGVMGYAEHLYQRGLRFQSKEHLLHAHNLFEEISYYAIEASHELSKERGSYATFEDSSWAQGKMPFDTFKTNGVNYSPQLYWDFLRNKARTGMRNSCLLAIAPTSTISDIAGTTPCIELPHKNMSIRENLSGQIKQVSPLLKYSADPETFQDADMGYVIDAASMRQKFIDQSQSLNLQVSERPQLGLYISDLYFKAWEAGVKTTYYLKSVSKDMSKLSGVCAIGDRDCESCQ
jgi:ribonucleoside-diphosphate reductase alpha chain